MSLQRQASNEQRNIIAFLLTAGALGVAFFSEHVMKVRIFINAKKVSESTH